MDYVITRLTVLGAVYLVGLCILPEVLISKLAVPFVLGGTTLLIVVQVTMDFVGQLQSHLIAYQYESLIKKLRWQTERDVKMNKDGLGLHIVFTGAPGCGKGTQARLLKERIAIPHLSTGEMLRAEAAKGTPLGLEIKALIDGGNLVPDE